MEQKTKEYVCKQCETAQTDTVHRGRQRQYCVPCAKQRVKDHQKAARKQKEDRRKEARAEIAESIGNTATAIGGMLQ